MYMLCYGVVKMETNNWLRNYMHEKRQKLIKKLKSNTLYKNIKDVARKGKPEKYTGKIAERFVFKHWDTTIYESEDCYPMYIDKRQKGWFIDSTQPDYETGWLVTDYLFCQPMFWEFFFGYEARTRIEVVNGRDTFVPPPVAKELADIMISLNHIFLDMGIGQLRNSKFGIMSSNKQWNYYVKSITRINQNKKLKM